ncbi:MAG: hydroxymethylglutaryl-CoA reductase, degradative [Woeseiaceae bacterium]|jgi:hydroxymethylglutaryl-CoA reductase|nr:hydroxymethylglutaryl-CoA reductase, degradative [Woeseiaceae bacterium]
MDARLKSLYRLNVAERITQLVKHGWLSADDARALTEGRTLLSVRQADKIIENVIGTFALPLGVAPNFRMNGRDYMVPMVVEEPSIVAALSNAAKLARDNGGFTASLTDSRLIGQVHLVDVPDVAAAIDAIHAAAPELIEEANNVHPRLLRRGGGVTGVEAREHALADGRRLLTVHFKVNTCDAMGANLVNTICEAMAPGLAELAGGSVAMRILSNLADESLVTARMHVRPGQLATRDMSGEEIAAGIVTASRIAAADPHRAATHNKGIMNGIDPLAIATGNDWRAIEAGAHAWAARDGRYRSLTTWALEKDGTLTGEIVLPVKVGTVGGTLDANPQAALCLAMTGVSSANELAELMAATGLAQNFAALKALASTGIQAGHMRLHARSIMASLDAPAEHFETAVRRLVDSGQVKDWKAREILEDIAHESRHVELTGHAAGKVILLGEHAVVYGSHALALPIRNAMRAGVRVNGEGMRLRIPAWHTDVQLDIREPEARGFAATAGLILDALEISERNLDITVQSHLPRAMGLGSSASLAVAVIRALDHRFGLGLDNERVNAIAFQCETLAHGTPSGVDNTLATYAEPLLFQNRGELETRPLNLGAMPHVLVAWGDEPGLTATQVAGVRERRLRAPKHFDTIFAEIDELTLASADALENRNYRLVGDAMNLCHGLLNALGVSTPTLEKMVQIAREAGALGAKLTGGGGGGSIVALCADNADEVAAALESYGFTTHGSDWLEN